MYGIGAYFAVLDAVRAAAAAGRDVCDGEYDTPLTPERIMRLLTAGARGSPQPKENTP